MVTYRLIISLWLLENNNGEHSILEVMDIVRSLYHLIPLVSMLLLVVNLAVLKIQVGAQVNFLHII